MAIHVYPEAAPILYRCRIHVPDDHGRHPILFLLHGVGDCEDDWDDVSGRKGSVQQWLSPNFPMYVVMPNCKPRQFPDGRQFTYKASFPDATQFVDYFEQGLVKSLPKCYPNIDWGRQAIGGISMGGCLAFEIAARRSRQGLITQTPFRCIGLFSAALQACSNMNQRIDELVTVPPRLLYLRRQTNEHPSIRDSNAEIIRLLENPPWLNQAQPAGEHNWTPWRLQLPEFLAMLPDHLT